MNEHNIKHLEFIQTNINRMNQNSLQMKGWAITIVSALLAIFVLVLIKMVREILVLFLFPQSQRLYFGYWIHTIYNKSVSFEGYIMMLQN